MRNLPAVLEPRLRTPSGARPVLARAALCASALLLASACATLGRGKPSAGTAGDWPTHNGAPAGERFSLLAEITPQNVAGLEPLCTFETGDEGVFVAGPVVVDGVVYATTDTLTFAIDGATCAVRWRREHERAPRSPPGESRGVAYLDGRVFRTLGDGHVLALDAATGRTLWDVPVADPERGERLAMAPIAWSGMVFVGTDGGDRFGVTGHVHALSVEDGRSLWRTDLVPGRGPVRATWLAASPENPPTGGGTFTSYTLDAEAGLLYVPAGAAAPAFVPERRPGPSLYASSVLALDARTGLVAGYVQPIKADAHAHEVAAAPALVKTRAGARLALAAAEDGILYGIDRGAIRRKQAVAPEQGLAPESLFVRYRAQTAPRENLDAPLWSDRPVRFCPGTLGGTGGNGPAFDPASNAVLVAATDWCTSVQRADPSALEGRPGAPWTGAADPAEPRGRQDPKESWGGWLSAFDADTGAVRWKFRSPTPILAGVIATAGGLVFTGDLDGNVLALELATGKELWRRNVGQPLGAGVVSYSSGGRQLVAVGAGAVPAAWPVKGGGSRIVVFGLKRRGAPGRGPPLYI